MPSKHAANGIYSFKKFIRANIKNKNSKEIRELINAVNQEIESLEELWEMFEDEESESPKHIQPEVCSKEGKQEIMESSNDRAILSMSSRSCPFFFRNLNRLIDDYEAELYAYRNRYKAITFINDCSVFEKLLPFFTDICKFFQKFISFDSSSSKQFTDLKIFIKNMTEAAALIKPDISPANERLKRAITYKHVFFNLGNVLKILNVRAGSLCEKITTCEKAKKEFELKLNKNGCLPRYNYMKINDRMIYLEHECEKYSAELAAIRKYRKGIGEIDLFLEKSIGSEIYDEPDDCQKNNNTFS